MTSKSIVNGIVSGKIFLFFLLTGFISVVIAICVPFKLNKKVQFATVDFLIMIFAFCVVVFLIRSNASEITTNHIIILLIVFLFFYFRFALQTNKRSIFWLTLCLIITGLVEAIWGLRQLYGFEQSQHSLFRLTGSFFNPGPYACFVAVIFPMAFYYTLKYRICYKVKFHLRNLLVYLLWVISLLTVVSSILILPATMSRTAWIACTGGCGLIFLTYMAILFHMILILILYQKQ
jgi:hypothetical protein